MSATTTERAPVGRAMRQLLAVETKLFVREPVGILFGLLFPALLLFAVGSLFPGFLDAAEELGGRRLVDVYAPVMLVFALAMLGITALPATLTTYRERGVLRRLRTTPISPARVLSAQLLVHLGSALLASLMAVAVAALAFNIDLPQNPLGFLLAFVLAAAALFTLGLLVAAIAPSASAGQALGTLLWFPLMFLAGLWFPRDGMPETLRTISDLSPAGAAVQALQDTWFGAAPSGTSLAVLALFAILAGVGAAKLFRWG